MVLNIEFPDFPTSLAQAFSAGKFKKVVPEPSPQVLSYKYDSSVADRISFSCVSLHSGVCQKLRASVPDGTEAPFFAVK